MHAGAGHHGNHKRKKRPPVYPVSFTDYSPDHDFDEEISTQAAQPALLASTSSAFATGRVEYGLQLTAILFGLTLTLTNAQWEGCHVVPIVPVKRESTSLILSVSASEQVLGRLASQPKRRTGISCARSADHTTASTADDCQHCRHLQQFLRALDEQSMVFEGLEECTFREQGWPPSQPALQAAAPTRRINDQD